MSVSPTVDFLPWTVVEFEPKLTYVCKFILFSNGQAYDFLLTDKIRLWRETLTLTQVKKRNLEINGDSIEAEPDRLSKQLYKILSAEGPRDTTFSLKADNPETQLIIEVNSSLAGFIFKWRFELRVCPPEDFSRVFVVPMALHVQKLQQAYEQLKHKVIAKDCELDEYKLTGAEILRKSRATEKFDESNFLHTLSGTKMNDRELYGSTYQRLSAPTLPQTTANGSASTSRSVKVENGSVASTVPPDSTDSKPKSKKQMEDEMFRERKLQRELKRQEAEKRQKEAIEVAKKAKKEGPSPPEVNI